jgi:hypothetical protein
LYGGVKGGGMEREWVIGCFPPMKIFKESIRKF